MASQAVQPAAAADAPVQPVSPIRAGIDVGAHYTARLHTSFDTIRQLWQRLEETGLCTGHQGLAWVEGIAGRLMPKSADLLVVEVNDAATGAPVMLLPLMRRRALGHYVIEWLSCGVCDYSAPLLADARHWTTQSADAAWAAVRAVLPPADRIHVAGIPRQIHGVANPLALLSAARDSIQIASGLVMDGEPETLIKRICKKSFTKHFYKHCRRFEQLGGLALVEAETPDMIEEQFGTLLDLRLNRFRELGRFDLLTQAPIVEFYRNAALQGLSDGSVRLFGLRVGQAYLAVIYVLVMKGTLHALLLGIDQEAVPNVSPGLTTIGKLMIWGRGQGLGYFDLSVGSQGYKQHIGAASSVLAELCEPMTLKGRGSTAYIRLRGKTELFVRSNPPLYKAVQGVMRRLRRLKT
ncbi:MULTISPECIES: GNAT family N-acetyltransferase [unclassified Mesorhizobium]|uniref:GNAT family N-acetyltransferase n=1 Tax=unclassified Mesorhizobium TaxID=325217 RepID=UPI000FD2F998|nr:MULTISPECIES: GNAT family N-acetyltransferase [unclassified Mesorhizobium]RUW98129.1 GNAT family N-acetyltransferase [Mesorhizobium sp. M8A.F.Ca.ET.023.01.1.1]RWC71264.1 MAG: GNAT family N-acetyltransferase [Mesorhizobium sp.]TGP89852.1 GNAT family N-acetyltransferase [Mesorhizobium sp. M8A.F.Ca.ET.218.01.1.1]TGT16344.1 GNAT family N-acetyltransferase [Mesorhizobium sp. M8A.F.Ca.ET.213.01.1.1]TIS95580.1 MAG: GNAT family N-acetyltransferase [Mesorhizobium sp.]